MKKIGLIFVLFFAYFICICDVYAYTVDNVVRWTGYITNHIKGVRYGEVNSEWDYFFSYDYCDTADSVYGCNIIEDNASVFGYYKDGSIIKYTKPNQNAIDSSNYYYGGGLYYYKNVGSYISDEGYVTTVANYETTDYVDFVLNGPFYITGSSIRVDFSIHINFNSIPSNIRKTIINNLYVLPNSGSGTTTYCDSTYSVDNERINVSCAFIDDGSDLVVRLKNNLPVYTDLEGGNYFYHTYFDISHVTYVMSTSDNFNDLDTSNSPAGDSFNDTYNVVSSKSVFFTEFQVGDFNGLARVITAPLSFIRSLTSESTNDLTINVFGKNVILKNGNSLFWNRRPGEIRVGSYYCNNQCGIALRDSFKFFWEVFVGYSILYFFTIKFIKVLNKTINPSNSDLEVF